MADDDDIVDVSQVDDAPLFGGTADDTFTSGSVTSEADLETLFAERQSVPKPLGKTWQFDFATGQFVREGGRVATVEGADAFAQWAMNVMFTERTTTVVHSDQIGVEFEEIVRSPQGSEIASLTVQNAVEEALRVHDRFDSLTRFTSRVEGEVVYVDMTVKTTEGEVDIAGRINT